MQKTATHKVFSMMLALLVLLSTFSFKIEAHFCGPKIVDVAVFSKVKSCCSPTVNANSESQFTKISCCTKRVVSVDGLNQFNVVSSMDELHVVKFFQSLSKFNSNQAFFISLVVDCNPNYFSPDLIMNPQVEHQVFLI